MVRNHGVDPRVAQEGPHALLLPGARAPGVLVEEVPARRELEAVDLHSEPEEHLSLNEPPPQLPLGHLGVLEVHRQGTVVRALGTTNDQVGPIPRDAVADALAVLGAEDVVGHTVLILLEVERGARHEGHARDAAAHPLQLLRNPRRAIELSHRAGRGGIPDAVQGVELEELAHLRAEIGRHRLGEAPQGTRPPVGAAGLPHDDLLLLQGIGLAVHVFVSLFVYAVRCLRRGGVIRSIPVDGGVRPRQGLLNHPVFLGHWRRLNRGVGHGLGENPLAPPPVGGRGSVVAGGLEVGRHPVTARLAMRVALPRMAGVHLSTL